MVTIVGSYLSPYVRKVLVCLHIKGIPYEIDPIVPFYGSDAFTEVSPLRRVPVLIDPELAIPDSSVICEYLEDRYPAPALYPRDPAFRAKARWIEEYAGSRMGEVFIWRFFNQLVIRRFVWEEQADPEVVSRSLEVDIPHILAYLESLVPKTGYLFGDITVADISLSTFFRNVSLAGAEIAMQGFPKTDRYIKNVLAHPGFQNLHLFEELSARTPIPLHRSALEKAGAPICAQTYFNAEPQRGILGTD